MKGKTALLVGAPDEVGEAVAAAFAGRGANVVVAARDQERGAAVVAQAQGGQALCLPLDFAAADSVARLIAAAAARFSRVDYAVNHIAREHTSSSPPARLHEISEAAWERIQDSAFKTVRRCMRDELAHMARHGDGAVVNLIAGNPAGSPRNAARYAAARNALALTETAAMEYGPRGIRVNAVCPGVMQGGVKDRAKAAAIARAVVWLCSDAASYVTGEALSLQGGD